MGGSEGGWVLSLKLFKNNFGPAKANVDEASHERLMVGHSRTTPLADQ